MTEPALPETPADFGPDAGASATRWISELNASEKDSASWSRRCKRIIRLYKDEDRAKYQDGSRRFNILWSNVQTIGPAIYANTPKAVVSRRFKDADPVARSASEVLERAINYGLEDYDFDERMIEARQDYLLCGRGQAWMRYEPTIETVEIEGADPVEQVTYERAVCDHVSWDDFLTNPAREWAEVRWVARRVYMDRDALVERFGDIGRAVPLDWAKGDRGGDDQFKKAQIYEIWDKSSKKAFWISKGYTAGPLDVRDDPLNLTDFFPCPRPIYATLGPDSLIPVPDYVLYQDQAEELDECTARMGRLIDALRLNGFYAGDEKSLIQRVFDPGNENKLIPVESWSEWTEKGGAKGLIEWVPIDMVIQALNGLQVQRQNVIQDIYQITGLSDIIRGASDPSETATAAGLKSKWGSLRVRDRQKELSRFARDIIRIKGEIIAEKFGVDTLRKMTGVQLLTNEERAVGVQRYQMAAQQAMAAQQPPPSVPPELRRPAWEEVKALLADNAQRQFRVEIETDSTIEPDDAEQKAAAVEFVTTISTIISQAGPMVQQAPALGRLVGEAVKFLTRRYRIGREMEETIDTVIDEMGNAPPPQAPGQPQGDPTAVQAAELELKTEQVKQQGQLQAKQMEVQMQQADTPLRMADLQLQAAAMQRDPAPQVVV